MKKRVIALILAAVMVFSMTACGSGSNETGSTDNAKSEEAGDDAADSETAGDVDSGEESTGEEAAGQGTDMNIAMITDSGDITDQSFNQTTYESCKSWAEANGATFTYYKPDSDSDEARNASVDQAVAGGANVIVMPGYMFAAAVVSQSELYPDVKFVALDVSAGDICEKGVGEGYDYNPDNWNVADYYNTDNVYCCTYQEEISGYMAGYAAVKLGYKHLGFLGGMSVPAVTRFGYGYVQGIDAAAKELGIENEVEVEYVCGGQFYGDADITAAMDTWYGTKNVEVVFACGGGIFTSAVEAAVKVDGKVIGVDSDQAPVIDQSGEGLTVTSAMKGLAATVNTVLTDIRDGKWSDYAGKIDNLGMVSENPEENYVQLPIGSTQWGDGFTEDDYRALVKSLYNGEIKVSNDITAMPATAVKVTDYGSVK
ncbi:MAG: BMP family ABC transporter substrate-binding protein [Lachnospiraceae bacterium]|nr:BMP family ABC transporter substrate-binding protein [Lachnospiraceae bacterium]